MNQKPSDVVQCMRRNDADERATLAALIVENPELGVNLRQAIRDRKNRDRAFSEPE